MANSEIFMPQLGESVTEGTVTRWLKQVGDHIEEDDLLFEVSTDKVDSEVPSPASGTLAEIHVQEGETVEVGTLLCTISDEAAPAVAAAPATPAAPEQADEEPTEPAGEVPAEPAHEEPTEPVPPPVAEPAPAPSAPPAPPPAVAPTAPSAPVAAAGLAGAGELLSPIVRRLVAEQGVDLAQVAGTGAGGRITRNDVMAHIEARNRGEVAGAPQSEPVPAPPPAAPPEPVPAAAAAPPRAAPPAAPSRPAGERDEVVEFNNIRRRTAEHMVMSKSTSPHVMISIEVDFENVERIRAANKAGWKTDEGFSLTYLPFIARAVCDSLREFPQINASVDGNSLVVHNYVNLGIAVDLDFNGLVVPVVRDADTKRLRTLAREIRDLADRARTKRLSPDDLMGGTYTITNPGPYGTFVSSPVINQPQVAIRSPEGVKKRPVVIESDGGDSIAVHHTGILSQVFDHRAFDGAYNSAYLRLLKETLETRDWQSELA